MLLTMLLMLAIDPALAQSRVRQPRELGAQDSKRIVGLLAIRPGEGIAVVGATSSFLLPELSSAVGPSGRVFVVDWDQGAIQGIRHRIEQENLSNVTAILGRATDALLPEPAHQILMVNSYRLIEDRKTFFQNNRKYLRPEARVAIIDYYRRPMRIGPPVRERVASHRVMSELKRFGFVLVDRHNISAYQYFLVYRPRARRT
jgi:ubiquinone/menaquinone biosynthesis C-methylase UbiE